MGKLDKVEIGKKTMAEGTDEFFKPSKKNWKKAEEGIGKSKLMSLLVLIVTSVVPNGHQT